MPAAFALRDPRVAEIFLAPLNGNAGRLRKKLAEVLPTAEWYLDDLAADAIREAHPCYCRSSWPRAPRGSVKAGGLRSKRAWVIPQELLSRLEADFEHCRHVGVAPVEDVISLELIDVKVDL